MKYGQKVARCVAENGNLYMCMRASIQIQVYENVLNKNLFTKPKFNGHISNCPEDTKNYF